MLLQVEQCPPKGYAKITTHSAWVCNLIWKQHLCRHNQVEVMLNQNGPQYNNTGVLIGRENRDFGKTEPHKYRHTEGRGYMKGLTGNTEGRGQSGTDRQHQRLGRSKDSTQSLRGSTSLVIHWILDFQLPELWENKFMLFQATWERKLLCKGIWVFLSQKRQNATAMIQTDKQWSQICILERKLLFLLYIPVRIIWYSNNNMLYCSLGFFPLRVSVPGGQGLQFFLVHYISRIQHTANS